MLDAGPQASQCSLYGLGLPSIEAGDCREDGGDRQKEAGDRREEGGDRLEEAGNRREETGKD